MAKKDRRVSEPAAPEADTELDSEGAAAPEGSAAESVGEQPPAPPARDWEYLRVIGAFSVLWPFTGAMHSRALAGAIIRSDDPLLDTSKLDPELAAKHGIERFATQAFKCAGAPDAAAVTPHNHPRAAAFYREVGYEGAVYDPGPSRLRPDGPPPRPTVRTSTPNLTPDDLKIPARDPVGAGAEKP